MEQFRVVTPCSPQTLAACLNYESIHHKLTVWCIPSNIIMHIWYGVGRNQAHAISPWSRLCIVSMMAKIKPLSSFVLQILSTNCVPGAEVEEINKIYLLSVRNWEYIKQIGSYNIKRQFLKQLCFLAKAKAGKHCLTWSRWTAGKRKGRQKSVRPYCSG